jgi:hypothetical protein
MTMTEGMTSLAKLRGQSDFRQEQKTTKPTMKEHDEEETEGGEEGHKGESRKQGEKGMMKTAHVHRLAMKHHKTMGDLHEKMAAAHDAMYEHHEAQLGGLTAAGRPEGNN